MVILTKQAVLFSDRASGEQFHAPNGYLGRCPEWVTKTRQFAEMTADGMIVAAKSSSDKEMADAADKADKKRAAKRAQTAEE